MAVAMVIIVVPGTPSKWNSHRAVEFEPLLQATMVFPSGALFLGGSWGAADPPWPHSVTHRVHGWPLVHGVTAIGYGGEGAPSERRPQFDSSLHYPGGWPISWAYRDAWPVAVDAAGWRPGAMAIKLAISMVICIVSGLAVEHWLHHRKKLWRVRLIDLLAATAVLSLGLGWVVYHKQRYTREQAQLDEAFASKGLKRGYPDHHLYDIAGPVWLTKLVGSEDYLLWRRVLSDEEPMKHYLGGDVGAWQPYKTGGFGGGSTEAN